MSPAFRSSLHPFRVFSLLLAFAVPACAPSRDDSTGSSEQRVIGDVASMTQCPADNSDPQCPAGSFSVTCTDGSKEVDAQGQVLANQACTKRDNPASCAGGGISSDRLRELFADGSSEKSFGPFAVVSEERDINGVGVASAWRSAEAPSVAWTRTVVPPSSHVECWHTANGLRCNTYPVPGIYEPAVSKFTSTPVSLKIDQDGNLSLVLDAYDTPETRWNAQCKVVGEQVSCGQLELGATPAVVNGDPLVFTGEIGAHCFALSFTDSRANKDTRVTVNGTF